MSAFPRKQEKFPNPGSESPDRRVSQAASNDLSLGVVSPKRSIRSPHWYGVPLRVALLTFIGTLLSFTVILLLAIAGTAIVSALRGMHPDMRIAYRVIAVPGALLAGLVIFVASLFMEIRHYRQSKTLSALEKMS